MAKTMSENDAFYAGVITALALVAMYDFETLYREIVGTVDEEDLIDFTVRDGLMEFSGLTKYGYGNKEQS